MIRKAIGIFLLMLSMSGIAPGQTGFEENFNAPVDLTFWRPHTGTKADGSTPIFNVTQEDTTLKVVMKQNSFSDGQFYDFSALGLNFDLDQAPRASVKIRVSPNLKYGTRVFKYIPFSMSPWNASPATGTRMHSNATVSVKADSLWHVCIFDWSTPDADQATYPNDYSSITGFLFETVQWPDTFSATFWIDDFRLGDKVVVSSVADRPGTISPEAVTLGRNYPNPFNPSTRISYSLPRESRARVTVLDRAGRTVAVLTDAWQSAGLHEIRFDASGLASGAYFYRLEAGGSSQTRKMALIR
jgi:hypothetical protein